MKELFFIQQGLNAPKGRTNTFGKYKYRSAEDILEAAKPLLKEVKATLQLTDEIVEIGGRVYVRATACLTSEDGTQSSVTAYAREAETKSGMDVAQITGATSSYARKYALNGLFCIDDAKDFDTDELHNQRVARTAKKSKAQNDWEVLRQLRANEIIRDMPRYLKGYTSIVDLKELYNLIQADDAQLAEVVQGAFSARQNELTNAQA